MEKGQGGTWSLDWRAWYWACGTGRGTLPHLSPWLPQIVEGTGHVMSLYHKQAIDPVDGRLERVRWQIWSVVIIERSWRTRRRRNCSSSPPSSLFFLLFLRWERTNGHDGGRRPCSGRRAWSAACPTAGTRMLLWFTLEWIGFTDSFQREPKQCCTYL